MQTRVQTMSPQSDVDCRHARSENARAKTPATVMPKRSADAAAHACVKRKRAAKTQKKKKKKKNGGKRG